MYNTEFATYATAADIHIIAAHGDINLIRAEVAVEYTAENFAANGVFETVEDQDYYFFREIRSLIARAKNGEIV